MSDHGQGSSHWFDDEAGPVVRPYAMTRGRTTSAAQHRLDLIAVVVAEPHADDAEEDPSLSPEHVDIVGLCRDTPSRSPNSPPGWICRWAWSVSSWAISWTRNSSM